MTVTTATKDGSSINNVCCYNRLHGPLEVRPTFSFFLSFCTNLVARGSIPNDPQPSLAPKRESEASSQPHTSATSHPPPSLASKRETEGSYIPPPSHAPSNGPQMPPPASHYPPSPPNARQRVRTSPTIPCTQQLTITSQPPAPTALPRFQTRDGGFVHPPIPCT